MESTTKNQTVAVYLTSDEALVLFEWIARFNEEENSRSFEDQSEQLVLYDLEAVLEKEITATFQDDYKDLLAKARDVLRDK